MTWITLCTIACAVFVEICIVGVSPADEPEPAAKQDLQQQVRQLVRQLDSPELKRREEAEQKLLALGAEILPWLPTPTARTSAEVRQRVSRVRQTLERARDEAFAAGSRVTLQGRFKLSAALEEITRQSGNKVIDYRRKFGQEVTDPELTLDFNDISFWSAIEQLQDLADLTIYPFVDQQAVAFVGRTGPVEPDSAKAIVAGAFRLQATRIAAERNLQEPTQRSLDLALRVQWEPKLSPIALLEPLDQVVARDETGTPVRVERREAQLEAPINAGMVSTELHLPFEPPERAASRISSLQGKVTALLPGGTETFDFENLETAKHVEQRRGGAVVTVEQVGKVNALWQVSIGIRFDENAGALESHRGWIFNNEVFLQGADGKPLKPDGYETTRQTENEVGLAYLFAVDSLKGKRLIYKSPTVILRLTLEYEMNDLLLP